MRHKSTELMGTIKAFVEEYYKNYRHSPSTTEIADAVGIARGTAYKYLVAMNENGMIRYDGQQISTEKTEKVQTEFTSVALLGAVSLDCQHFFRQIFLGYFPDIVQAFDTLGRNVYGDDYTSLHNPIVLSSVLLVYGMFHSTQILF